MVITVNYNLLCVGSFEFLKSVYAFGCNAVNLFGCPDTVKQIIKKGVTEGIESGAFKPFEADTIYGLRSTQELLNYLRLFSHLIVFILSILLY